MSDRPNPPLDLVLRYPIGEKVLYRGYTVDVTGYCQVAGVWWLNASHVGKTLSQPIHPGFTRKLSVP